MADPTAKLTPGQTVMKKQITGRVLAGMNLSDVARKAIAELKSSLPDDIAKDMVPDIIVQDIVEASRQAESQIQKGGLSRLKAVGEMARNRLRVESEPDTYRIWDELAESRARRQTARGIQAPAAAGAGGVAEAQTGTQAQATPKSKIKQLNKEEAALRKQAGKKSSEAAKHKKKAAEAKDALKWAGMKEDDAKKMDEKSGLKNYYSKQWNDAKNTREAEMAAGDKSEDEWKQDQQNTQTENENKAEELGNEANDAQRQANRKSRESDKIAGEQMRERRAQEAFTPEGQALERLKAAQPATFTPSGGAAAAAMPVAAPSTGLPSIVLPGDVARLNKLREDHLKSQVARSRAIPLDVQAARRRTMEQEEIEEETYGGSAQSAALAAQNIQAQSQMAVLSQLFSAQQQARVQEGEGDMTEQVREQVRETIRKEVKKMGMKAIRYLTESATETAVGAVDITSVGLSTFITIIIHAISLGDLNLQMIWGYYITDKKSFLFPPLEWKPIPAPGIPDVVLHAALVAFDLILLILIGCGILMLIIIILSPLLAILGALSSILSIGGVDLSGLLGL